MRKDRIFWIDDNSIAKKIARQDSDALFLVEEQLGANIRRDTFGLNAR